MRKRISLLIAALMMALTMSFGGATAAFADPSCDHVGDNNKNCVKDGPGKSENSGGKAADNNPNFKTTFKDRPQ
jgi:hypothetical protein